MDVRVGQREKPSSYPQHAASRRRQLIPSDKVCSLHNLSTPRVTGLVGAHVIRRELVYQDPKPGTASGDETPSRAWGWSFNSLRAYLGAVVASGIGAASGVPPPDCTSFISLLSMR